MPVKPLSFEVVQCKSANTQELVARSGHRMVIDHGNLYCWGGYNPNYWDVENTEDTEYPLFKELWQFNIWSRKWKKLQTTGTVPKELASHYILKIGNHILHFGGTAVPFGITSTNRLYDLDLHTLEWKCCSQSADTPSEKYGHTMTLIDRYIYTCGGTTGFVYNMDIHRFDLTTLTWEQVKPESRYCPEPRYRHEVVYYDRKLFLFGGGTGLTAHALDKIDVFDIDTRVWQSVITKPCNHSEFPEARKCHSCTRYRDDMYLCGGMTGGGLEESSIHADVWKFHLPTYQWTRLKTKLPVPVYFHTADVTSEGCLYIFGGVCRIDDERTNCLQKIWFSIPTLKTLAWSALTDAVDTDLLVHNKETVIHFGIPSYLLDLLS